MRINIYIYIYDRFKILLLNSFTRSPAYANLTRPYAPYANLTRAFRKSTSSLRQPRFFLNLTRPYAPLTPPSAHHAFSCFFWFSASFPLCAPPCAEDSFSMPPITRRLRGAYAPLTRNFSNYFRSGALIAASESASTLTSMIGELIQKRDLNKKHEISKHLFCFGQLLRAAYATLRAPVFLMRHACAQLTQPYAHQRFG